MSPELRLRKMRLLPPVLFVQAMMTEPVELHAMEFHLFLAIDNCDQLVPAFVERYI